MSTLLIYILTMAITPGPNTVLSAANAASVGLRKGIRLNLGMLLGIAVVTAVSWAAAEFLYAYIPRGERIMKVAAFIYLLYLSYRMLRGSLSEASAESAGFLQGMLLQLINVKVYLLALTAISAYIMPMAESLVWRAAYASLIPLICFLSGLVWAAGGAMMKRLFTHGRRLLSILFALALLWCAFSLISS